MYIAPHIFRSENNRYILFSILSRREKSESKSVEIPHLEIFDLEKLAFNIISFHVSSLLDTARHKRRKPSLSNTR